MTKYKEKIQQIDTTYVQANSVSAHSIYSGGLRDAHAHDRDNLSLRGLSYLQDLAAHLMTPSLPSGDHLFLVVDYNSQYMEIQVPKFTTTDKIIESLKRMFLIHGLPVSLTTDNGH